jgi:hypothetical protein
VTGFAFIWHIWWIAALGAIGAFATLLVFAFRDQEEVEMPAKLSAEDANRLRRVKNVPPAPISRSDSRDATYDVGGELRLAADAPASIEHLLIAPANSARAASDCSPPTSRWAGMLPCRR